MKKLAAIFRSLKKAAGEFNDDEGFKLSASLSYYTIFSIAPFLLIVISIASAAFRRESVETRVYGQIRQLVGPQAAASVQEIITNVQLKDQGVWGLIIGVAVLIVGATSVFTEIQGSINYIWSIRTKPRKGLIKLLLDRLLSFSLIIGVGFILLVSLVINSLMDAVHTRLEAMFKDSSVHLLYAINLAAIFIVITLLFTIIYKVLPDAKINWKDSTVGAAFTAVLFIIGKFLIGLYIGNSSLGATYGTVASVFVILVWIYYTSIILYFGAEFTKVYSRDIGKGIKPSAQAVYIVKSETKELPSLRAPVKSDPKPGRVTTKKNPGR
ncbi:MAG: YihY/virulence factor BrkB family protein [Chitinophagaceae bacterium]|nr:YihY/virulence factor BrkB family protein [Chitinophagaceae bacterium]